MSDQDKTVKTTTEKTKDLAEKRPMEIDELSDADLDNVAGGFKITYKPDNNS